MCVCACVRACPPCPLYNVCAFVHVPMSTVHCVLQGVFWCALCVCCPVSVPAISERPLQLPYFHSGRKWHHLKEVNKDLVGQKVLVRGRVHNTRGTGGWGVEVWLNDPVNQPRQRSMHSNFQVYKIPYELKGI